jgi:hypothetical protein
MNIVEQLIQEINHESSVHGPHWTITEYCGYTTNVQEGSGSTTQMLEMLETHRPEIDCGIYIKYPKNRFIPNEEPYTNDWSRITMETAIIKVVFPQMGKDTVWLLAPQHPFP